MPTYEYKCDEGHELALTQKITDDPITECHEEIGYNHFGPEFCNAPCRRQLSSTAFILKGDNWAKDGYSRGGSKKKKE
jgi:predicted nucleic acid-binding Zn ribbon protein